MSFDEGLSAPIFLVKHILESPQEGETSYELAREIVHALYECGYDVWLDKVRDHVGEE